MKERKKMSLFLKLLFPQQIRKIIQSLVDSSVLLVLFFFLVFARVVEFMVEVQRHLFMVATVPNLITHENLSLA